MCIAGRRLRPPVLVLVLTAAGLVICKPGHTLPEFARRYGVTCQACHSVPPRLNTFGLAFQANHFNWPGQKKAADNNLLNRLPISAIATGSYSNNFTADKSDTDFRDLVLFAADELKLGRMKSAGYFVQTIIATRQSGERVGGIFDTFAAVPVAASNGQFALVAGQVTPMLYQYDPLNSLTSSQPAALSLAADGFSMLSPMPSARLEWFDNRQKGTADGNYAAIDAPFGGTLAFNHTSRWDGGHGVALHGFHRKGLTSYGLFGYFRSGNHVESIAATHDVGKEVHLLGAASLGHDATGGSHGLSLQGDYTQSSQLALTGRLDVLKQPAGSSGGGGGIGGYSVVNRGVSSGSNSTDVGMAAAVNYYPLKQQFLRLTAELVERRANRSFTLFAHLQY